MCPGENIVVPVIECHTPVSGNVSHICNIHCSVAYPLRKDGVTCGVSALAMLSLAALEQDYFDYLLGINKMNEKHQPYIFLSDPTKYRR